MRTRAADGARIGANSTENETNTGKDALIGRIHLVVRKASTGFITVKRIGVLHREFTTAHHPETRTALVAEFRLNVEEIHRQLTPALDFMTGDIGDDLFGRRLQHEVAHMTIFDAQEFGTVLLPASGFLPEFCRLHHRHQQFNRSGTNHFVADNVFNFADDAKAKRHVGIYAGGKLLDHAGANHVLLADDVGIGRRFFESRNEKGTGSHIKWRHPPRRLPPGCLKKRNAAPEFQNAGSG